MTIKYGKLIIGHNVVDTAREVQEVREKQPPMSIDEIRERVFARKETAPTSTNKTSEKPVKSSQYMIDMLNPDL